MIKDITITLTLDDKSGDFKVQATSSNLNAREIVDMLDVLANKIEDRKFMSLAELRSGTYDEEAFNIND